MPLPAPAETLRRRSCRQPDYRKPGGSGDEPHGAPSRVHGGRPLVAEPRQADDAAASRRSSRVDHVALRGRKQSG
jgi:hypothetical protein